MGESGDDEISMTELVSKARQLFVERLNNNVHNFDEVDVNRIKDDEWWVKRFLKFHRNDVNKSVDHIMKTLEWRREFGINSRDERMLPQEFVQVGAIFPCGYDNEGRIVFYIRTKVNRKVPQLSTYFRQFLVGVIDRVDLDAGESGYGMVFDLSGVGFSNVDMDFLQFLINTLKDYFPCGLRYVLVYNLPRLLRPLWNIAKLWVGPHQKLIQFANGNEIKEYIPVEHLPKYLGGECDFDFTQPPDGCKSVYELAPEYGFTDEEVKKYLKMFEPNIKEAYKLVHGSN